MEEVQRSPRRLKLYLNGKTYLQYNFNIRMNNVFLFVFKSSL